MVERFAFHAEEDTNAQSLLQESKGHALLDTGCARSVCGQGWLYKTFRGHGPAPEPVPDAEPSSFIFGDGKKKVSLGTVVLHTELGGRDTDLSVEVVEGGLPLLLSDHDFSQMRGTYDSHAKTITLYGNHTTQLKTASSSHKLIPLWGA